jgi:hypothetical protein
MPLTDEERRLRNREATRRWCKANRERWTAYVRKWQRENPDRCAAHKAEYLRRLREANARAAAERLSDEVFLAEFKKRFQSSQPGPTPMQSPGETQQQHQ